MGTLRVLIVDDEAKIRTSVARALEGQTFRFSSCGLEEHRLELLEADSGEEGLEVIARERPDIVFLDLMLPRMTGLDVLERLSDLDHDLLAVLITAFASIETAVAATKRGAWDVLAKPFMPDDVRAVIQKGGDHLLARRSAATLARERAQVRYHFVSQIAHELNTPLQVIQGYLELLGERALGEEIDSYDRAIDKMLGRALKMRKIIEDLHSLTRLEAGEKVRTIEDVDVEEAALSAMESVGAMASARDIKVSLHQEGGDSFRADRTDLESVLDNLLTNAVKYNRDGGRVDLQLDQLDSTLRIRVIDTGVGIAEDDAARIFEEFYRVKAKETEGVTGSGLGLAIVRRIAASYDGEVDVSSAPGEGTTFTVTLHQQ